MELCFFFLSLDRLKSFSSSNLGSEVENCFYFSLLLYKNFPLNPQAWQKNAWEWGDLILLSQNLKKQQIWHQIAKKKARVKLWREKYGIYKMKGALFVRVCVLLSLFFFFEELNLKEKKNIVQLIMLVLLKKIYFFLLYGDLFWMKKFV